MSDVDLRCGDALEVLRGMEADSVDAVVTDPPYGLEFMGKEWDAPWKRGFADYGLEGHRMAAPVFGSKRNPVCRACHKHQRGKDRCQCASPDYDETRTDYARAFGEWCEGWAREAFRVLKPGGHLLAFGGSRTSHRMVCAIEDAGFEIRDSIAWVYGSGFPKSLDVSKAIDKEAGAERTEGARLWTGGRRTGCIANSPETNLGTQTLTKYDTPATDAARQWAGFGTSLKPALEPICLARKPLSEGTIAANVLRWGTGAINVDGCRVETGEELGRYASAPKGRDDGWGMRTRQRDDPQYAVSSGRFPANLIHDGSEEVRACFPETTSVVRVSEDKDAPGATWSLGRTGTTPRGHSDAGSAARFFRSCPPSPDDRRLLYVPKPSRAEREAGCEGLEGHPTVKPIALMRYLVRLVTPPGGTVLDCFMGSGTTGCACTLEGFGFIGIEREAEYMDIARARVAHWQEEAKKARAQGNLFGLEENTPRRNASDPQPQRGAATMNLLGEKPGEEEA